MGEVSGPDDRDTLAPRPPGEPRNVTVLAARPGEARVDMQVGVKHAASLAAFSEVVGPVLGIRLSRVCALLFALPPPPRPGGGAGRPGPLRGDPPRAHAGPRDRSRPDAVRPGHLHCAALRCCPACCCRDAGVLGTRCPGCRSSACRVLCPAGLWRLGQGRFAGLPRRAAGTGRPSAGPPGHWPAVTDRPGLAGTGQQWSAVTGRVGTGWSSRYRAALTGRH